MSEQPLRDRARGALRRGRSRLQRHPRLVRAGLYVGRLSVQLWRKLVDDDCLDRAGSLAYTSVLAVVPLMAVSFMAFRLSGAFDGVERQVRTWMLESLLAESVGSVSEVIDVFLNRVSAGAVGVTGVVMLIFTATWLFITAEGTLNHIWRVAKPRSIIARFTTFWALLTLGPLLIGVGFYLSAQFRRTALGYALETSPLIQSTLAVTLPYLLSALGLTMIYKLVPNTKVRWRAALVGGLVAAILFELSKRGFNLYVTQIYQGSTTTRIYGAFALFPVFLLWIYIVWIVVLFGAVVGYTVQHLDLIYDEEFRQRAPESGEGTALSPYLACRLLLLVAYRHHRGDAPLTQEALASAVRMEERTVYQGLERLERGGLLMTVDRSGEPVWLPARDIGSITLEDALGAYALAGVQPHREAPTPDARALDDLFCDLQIQQREALGDITFAALAETVRPADFALLLEGGTAAVSPEDEAKQPAPLPRSRGAKKRAESDAVRKGNGPSSGAGTKPPPEPGTPEGAGPSKPGA